MGQVMKPLDVVLERCYLKRFVLTKTTTFVSKRSPFRAPGVSDFVLMIYWVHDQTYSYQF